MTSRGQTHPHRAIAEYMGGTTVRYHWPCGHFRTEDMSKRSIRHKGIAPEGVRMLARYWGANNDGVDAGPCPTCKRNRA